MPVGITRVLKFTCEKCKRSRIVNTIGDCIHTPTCRRCGCTMQRANDDTAVKLAGVLGKLAKRMGIRLF